MKNNSRKIALLLAIQQLEAGLVVGYDHLARVCSDITPGGLRSLVALGEKNGYWQSRVIDNQAFLQLSTRGKESILEQYPALSQQSETWTDTVSMIVFLNASPKDKNFTYLRKKITSDGWQQLERGSYIYPGPIRAQLAKLCQQEYAQNVVLGAFSAHDQLQLRNILLEKYSLIELSEAYSGISRQLGRLIKLGHVKKRLTQADIESFFSLFNQFSLLLADDIGLVSNFFPRVPAATGLASDFAKVLQLFQLR